MRKSIFLILPVTFILFSKLDAQAQQVESLIDRPYLALVKGDTANSCSFISADLLQRTADIVQALVFVRPGDSLEEVRYKMRFVPDQPNATNTLQWTAVAGGNYTEAIVNLRNNSAQSRSFTMAINYNQPNERRCEWQVRDPQQEIPLNSPTSPLPTEQ
ncbi:MAG: hypothetical protein KME28_10065 [Pelatocladus maniniholoensis HA4357-MV3]|jgi:hypothetical protein|uniref:Uncharacterized protein n=1 Tax=Pelatocladus maniniholoensis HA4357-MV3 TaxID=1117104 RepID=A0A9E3H783_9NOST|nr:hypothetical protein [Pelatocladus maniniholoensis HA4357-MV3]BAZ66676.1 hypothetical protein NIES4106_14280 [Fischerella sp. NIES-4106]